MIFFEFSPFYLWAVSSHCIAIWADRYLHMTNWRYFGGFCLLWGFFKSIFPASASLCERNMNLCGRNMSSCENNMSLCATIWTHMRLVWAWYELVWVQYEFNWLTCWLWTCRWALTLLVIELWRSLAMYLVVRRISDSCNMVLYGHIVIGDSICAPYDVTANCDVRWGWMEYAHSVMKSYETKPTNNYMSNVGCHVSWRTSMSQHMSTYTSLEWSSHVSCRGKVDRMWNFQRSQKPKNECSLWSIPATSLQVHPNRNSIRRFQLI